MVDILVDEINNFDCYYEMSDDEAVYAEGDSTRISILNRIKKLNNSDLTLLIDSLNNIGKINYNRYFK